MKYNFTLTYEQQALVEQNLELVHKIIRRYIKTNENVCGLGYDDLYQEGSMALCHAAATYDGVSAQFGTYATILIRNHLLDQCKAASVRQKRTCGLPIDTGSGEDEYAPSIPEPSVSDDTDELIGRLDTSALLSYCKNKYSEHCPAGGRGAGAGAEGQRLQRRGYCPALPYRAEPCRGMDLPRQAENEI